MNKNTELLTRTGEIVHGHLRETAVSLCYLLAMPICNGFGDMEERWCRDVLLKCVGGGAESWDISEVVKESLPLLIQVKHYM